MATAESIREKLRDKIATQLPDLDPLQVKDLEIGIYNWTLSYADRAKILKTWKNARFMNVYLHKCRSVVSNLDTSSYVKNGRLLDRLKEGEFAPHDIASMENNFMFPERWKDIMDSKMRHDDHVYQEKPAAMTAEFKCSKCRKRECVYQELQLRSCDEPVSLFITCLNCGHRWRMG